MFRIALDMMGGDLGGEATVSGLSLYANAHDCGDVVFDLFGNAAILSKSVTLRNCEIHDTEMNVISATEKPAKAIKAGRGTSMFEAISWVARGNADAVVSSGNTGAYMALSKMLIGTIDGIDRPAIVSIIPNLVKSTVMLDLGANTDCSPAKLLQFAIMGKAVSRILQRINNPRIGLLNIGTERTKGTDALEEAYELFERSKELNFIGFVEGTDIAKGTADIIVTDGFTGNIALKTMEGTIRYVAHTLKTGFSSSLMSKIGYIFCRRAIKTMKDAIDPRNHNGAPLVGLKKISIKSHGNSDAVGFANAISVAVKLAKSGFVSNIEKMISEIEKGSADENKNS
ncbi:MAG: phosphate acyltransferase PlsX [Alphaproteobacteria bacterium]|nr:phosphate acyltransferase PlsX [Alphaproteobacteria bacterium]